LDEPDIKTKLIDPTNNWEFALDFDKELGFDIGLFFPEE